MSKDLVELNDQELTFIEALIDNGGNLYQAAAEANYNPRYAYRLRNRLAKAITQAAHEYLAVNSLRAAAKVVDAMDAEVANPHQLNAAQQLLDRVGIIKKDHDAETAPVIKANIFILPEKRSNEIVIEVEGKYNTGLLAVTR